MRYEVLRLVQFLFSLGLIVAAFAGGLALGWWRWGRAQRVPGAPSGGRVAPPDGAAPRQDLFAPELDLSEVADDARRSAGAAVVELEAAPVAALPRITAPAASTSGAR